MQGRLIVQSAQGRLLELEKSSSGVTVNGISLAKADNTVSNGVFHVVNQVLKASQTTANGNEIAVCVCNFR